jgi:hypothetical protein
MSVMSVLVQRERLGIECAHDIAKALDGDFACELKRFIGDEALLRSIKGRAYGGTGRCSR